MKANKKVKEFEAKIGSILKEQKTSIKNAVDKHLESFSTIEFIKFDNVNPYGGEFRNKIFFTYSDHYSANSGTWMTVGNLHHPHVNFDDRGYIKGVATDLDGYMKLRSAKLLNHNFDVVVPLYMPRFSKSKYSEQSKFACIEIHENSMNELNEFILQQHSIMNKFLHDLTGCSLLYYLNNI